jgi:chemotaxis protein MotC
MTRFLHSMLPILTLAVLAAAAPVHSEDARPFELIRSLRAAQDRIAHGDVAAREGQRRLLADIGARMARADDTVWKDARNARAVIVYVLSGGDPAVLKDLRGRGVLTGVEEDLVKGVLGYSEGRNADAELLLGIATKQLDASVAGHLALVQSTLTMHKDAARALALLDEARLSSPGTLVEEAALRRQAFLALAAGNRDLFEALSSRYLRRFADSVYAESFRRQFATEVVGQKYAVDAARLERLEAILADLAAAHRLDIYLMMSAEGIVRGKVEAIRMAAGQASGLAEADAAAKARAELYKGAALVATDELESGLAALEGIDKSLLDGSDGELLEAALALAGEMRRWPESGDAAGGMPEIEAKAHEAERPVISATARVLSAAQKSNARVDQMLSGAAK